MEAVMSRISASLSFMQDGISAEDSDRVASLREAQEIIYDAWETPDPRKQVTLAKEALAFSDLCADAFLVLADKSKSIVEARNYYERAVAAGESAVRLEIGPDAFTEQEGHFWGILETRPYMRSLAGLSECIWEMGEREESVALLRRMLRLNPNDNQGMRSFLVSKLFTLDDLTGVADILETYREPFFCEWNWNMALLLFRREGDSAAADSALAEALENNRFVSELLIGTRRIPAAMPQYYTLGSLEEAATYAFLNEINWSGTKGALFWIAEKTKEK